MQAGVDPQEIAVDCPGKCDSLALQEKKIREVILVLENK